jgi:hypothetical protein
VPFRVRLHKIAFDEWKSNPLFKNQDISEPTSADKLFLSLIDNIIQGHYKLL